MPKRRNFVKKHMDTFQKPKTHRDRTKYDRYEDYLKDQLDDYVTGEWDDLDEDEQAETKKKFVAAIKGEEYDPDLREEWNRYIQHIDPWEEAIARMAEDIRDTIDQEIIDGIEDGRYDDYDY